MTTRQFDMTLIRRRPDRRRRYAQLSSIISHIAPVFSTTALLTTLLLTTFAVNLAAQDLYYDKDSWMAAYNSKKASLLPGTQLPDLGTEQFHELLIPPFSCINNYGICPCGIAGGKSLNLSSFLLVSNGQS